MRRFSVPLIQAARAAAVVLTCATACSNAVNPTAAPTATVTLPSTVPDATPSPAPTVPAELPSTPAIAPMPTPTTAEVAAAPPVVMWDEKTNTLTLQSGEATLAGIRDQAPDRGRLVEVGAGEWLLKANLAVARGAHLRVAGPETIWLKLASGPAGFVWLKALGGALSIESAKVTSWDVDAGAVDTRLDDGRGFVLARDGGRMDIRDAELSYLGYRANESYGVAWRMKGTTGSAERSTFGHNFYGVYAHEASGLVIRGNTVHDSAEYGIDPHTQSNRLLIEDNVSRDNGKQGIILAAGCSDSTVRNNTVFGNGLHGIVLYQQSNNNVVEGNTSYRNGLQGINVNDAAGNTVRANTVYENGESGIGLGGYAQDNRIEGNAVLSNTQHGIYLYSGSRGNVLAGNTVRANAQYGIYIKSDGNVVAGGNVVTGNAVGVYLRASDAGQALQPGNRISDNGEDVKTAGAGADE